MTIYTAQEIVQQKRDAKPELNNSAVSKPSQSAAKLNSAKKTTSRDAKYEFKPGMKKKTSLQVTQVQLQVYQVCLKKLC